MVSLTQEESLHYRRRDFACDPTNRCVAAATMDASIVSHAVSGPIGRQRGTRQIRGLASPLRARRFHTAAADGKGACIWRRVAMQSGLYVALSAQVALEKRMTTIATNVANMNTVGYRADQVSFESVISRTTDKPVAFASAGDTFISRRGGAMIKTDNPLDVAVQGEGWLAIQTPQGTAYTRDGRMQMKDTGELVTLNGYPILDAGNSGLVVDPNAGPPSISHDGMLSQNGQQIGALGLFTIDENANLARFDNSAVIPDRPATPTLDFGSNGIVQGFVEGANVNPVMEMTKLIMVTHAFDSVSNAIETSEASLQDAIKTLGASS
jgi:flagellar basal-body rod protein FlgF